MKLLKLLIVASLVSTVGGCLVRSRPIAHSDRDRDHDRGHDRDRDKDRDHDHDRDRH